MGGKQSKNTETIWNNIKTENMSASLPGLKNLSKDAQTLIASLNIPEITESQTSEFTVNHILNTLNNSLNMEDKAKLGHVLHEINTDTELVASNTSPFISSQMYENLVNSKTSSEVNIQAGGAFHSNKITDKSTSSTSSDSDLDSLDSSSSEFMKDSSSEKKNKKHHKKHDKKHDKKHETKHETKHSSRRVHSSSAKSEELENSSEESSQLSYVSSSAHTDGEFSSEKSVANENTMQSTSISVNTSDINMISDY